jgi:hypothetical protein
VLVEDITFLKIGRNDIMKIKIDLTAAAAKELTRISEQTGLSKAKVIQKSFNLFRTYLESTANGSEWLFLPNTSLDDYSHLERITVPGLKL